MVIFILFAFAILFQQEYCVLSDLSIVVEDNAWSSDIAGLRTEVAELRAEQKASFEIMMDMLRKISLQVASSSSRTIALNPAVQLPPLPFQRFEEIEQFNGRLRDPLFMDQMVSLFLRSLFFVIVMLICW